MFFHSTPKQITSLVLLISLLATGCMSLPTTNKRKGESLESTIITRETPLTFSSLEPQEEMVSRGVALAAILAKGLPIAVDGIKALIKKDQEKYTASYQQVKSHHYFYAQPSASGALDPQNIQFQGIQLTRYFATKQDSQKVALKMRLEMDEEPQSLYNLLNNSLFQLRVKELDLQYAKAKVPAAKWYMPWTLIYKNNDILNLDVAVTFYASWIDEQGNIHNNEKLGTSLLTLRDIPINEEDALKEYSASLKGKKLDGYFYLVPRSAGSYLNNRGQVSKGFGQGVYSVDISVTESGKEEFVNKIIFENVDALDALPKSINFK